MTEVQTKTHGEDVMDEEGDEKEKSVGGYPKPLLSEIGKRIRRSERTPRHSTYYQPRGMMHHIEYHAGSVQTTLLKRPGYLKQR